MSTVAPQKKVLVTEAEGYLAAAVCFFLAQRGYFVIGTVKTMQSYELWILASQMGRSFIPIVVPDPSKPNVFDEIFQAHPDISAVIHMSAPASLPSVDPKTLLNSKVAATNGVLSAAARYGPNVRRVVMTSAATCLLELIESPLTFNRSEWENYSVAYVNKQIQKLTESVPLVYRTSKTISETAAWNFVASHQPKFELVTVQPVLAPTPPEKVPLPAPINENELPAFDPNVPVAREGFLSSVGAGSPLANVNIRLVHSAQSALAHVLTLELPDIKPYGGVPNDMGVDIGSIVGGGQLKFAEAPQVWSDFCDAAARAGINTSSQPSLLDRTLPQILYEWV